MDLHALVRGLEEIKIGPAAAGQLAMAKLENTGLRVKV